MTSCAFLLCAAGLWAQVPPTPTSLVQKPAPAFVRNDLAIVEVLQPQLTAAVYDCARELGHDVYTPAPLPRWKSAVMGAVGGQLRKRVAVPAQPL